MDAIRFAAACAVLLSLAFLSGCAQGSLPPSCAGVQGARIANCIYSSAVMDQNPYYCYSLSSLSQREKCLRDSTDANAKKTFEALSPQERAKVFMPESEQNLTAPLPEQQPMLPQQNSSEPSPSQQPGQSYEVSEADAMAYMQAINSNDLAPCVTILDDSTRASCITQVAQKVKRPDICPMFTKKDDFDLCNMYAKAGEQAK